MLKNICIALLTIRVALRTWSDAKLGAVWSSMVLIFIILLAVNVRFAEPFSKVDLPMIAIGFLAFVNAVYNETRGQYATRAKIIFRVKEPRKFANETNMLLFIALFVTIGGFVLEAWGLCLVSGVWSH